MCLGERAQHFSYAKLTLVIIMIPVAYVCTIKCDTSHKRTYIFFSFYLTVNIFINATTYYFTVGQSSLRLDGIDFSLRPHSKKTVTTIIESITANI